MQATSLQQSEQEYLASVDIVSQLDETVQRQESQLPALERTFKVPIYLTN